ncbi:uncharacterized protein TNCV_1937201 [Trichonephila clavipes]|nr:uncharacterized protein TNCV_1937201 [Trichonephila clavipes]
MTRLPSVTLQVARGRQNPVDTAYDVGSVVSVLADVGSSSQLRSVVSLWFLLMALDVWKEFDDPLKCANCGEEHAANWRQCPRFPKSKKAPNHQNKGGNIKHNNTKPSNKNINQRNQNTAPEVMSSSQNLKHNNQLRSPQSYRTTDLKLPYSKVVSGQIPANQPRKNINNNNDQNFSAIFCSVLAISNDAGVDQNLLAKAFWQALPALKHLNDANEKACVIFEAYVTIVQGRNYAPILTA